MLGDVFDNFANLTDLLKFVCSDLLDRALLPEVSVKEAIAVGSIRARSDFLKLI